MRSQQSNDAKKDISTLVDSRNCSVIAKRIDIKTAEVTVPVIKSTAVTNQTKTAKVTTTPVKTVTVTSPSQVPKPEKFGSVEHVVPPADAGYANVDAQETTTFKYELLPIEIVDAQPVGADVIKATRKPKSRVMESLLRLLARMCLVKPLKVIKETN